MFAIFTRLAWLLMQPSSLVAVAFLWGIILLHRGHHRSAQRWLMGALAALVIGGFSTWSDALIIPLEDRFSRPDLANADITGLIVLGGSEDARVAIARNVIAVNDSAERLIDAAALARRFPKARVLFTGGGEALGGVAEPEAVTAARTLEALGVTGDRMTLETQSLTTWDNAKFSAPLIAQKPGDRWLLITSASHMPRAMGAFRKVGVFPEAYPVDFRTTGSVEPFHIHGSISDGFRRLDYIVREYPGLLVYWLTGRTTTLFPGP